MLDDRPYRERVEMLVVRGQEVLITVNPMDDGTTWHGLPGGGVDEGENLLEAAKRETLEEVGIRVRNVIRTEFIGIKEQYKSADQSRVSKYRGSRTHLYTGVYDRDDHSLYNKDGDAVKFIWCHHQEAYDLLKAHITKSGGSGDHILKYFESLGVK